MVISSFLWLDPRAKHTGTYEFGPRHVEVLFKQLDKARKSPEFGGYDISFALFSDCPVASDFPLDLVTYYPLWDRFREMGRCFVRLGLFKQDFRNKMAPPNAIWINIDLDVVITDPEGFLRVMLKDHEQAFTGYRDSKNPRCYSGALWKLDPRYGDVSHVYGTFDHMYQVCGHSGGIEPFFNSWSAPGEFVGSDQCWITTALGEFTYPRKIDNLTDFVYDYWTIEDLPGGALPERCVCVFMNGKRRDSSMSEFQQKHDWIIENWVNV